MLRATPLLLLILLSCQPDQPLPVSLERNGDTLSVVSAPGIRLNAEYDPKLVLREGDTLRFTSAERSADSLWFGSPPRTVLRSRDGALDGELRVSLCDNDAGYCRLLVSRVVQGRIVRSEE